MQLKRIISFLIGIIMLCSCFAVALADEMTKMIYLDVDFKSNLLLHKYDVDLYLDNKAVARIPHGERYVELYEVEEGNHTFKFTRHGDKDVYGNLNINVTDDTTIKCSITAEKKTVEISEAVVRKNGVWEAFLVVPDLSYVLLENAMSGMQERGFDNVVPKDLHGSQIKKYDGWIVVGQRPSGGTEARKDNPIILSCMKDSEFVNQLTRGKHPLEVYQIIRPYGFITSDFYSRANNKVVPKKEDGTIQDNDSWTVAWSSVSANKTVWFSLTYIGEKVMPNVIGKKLPEAKKILYNEEFYNISYKENVWQESNWTVVGQNIRAGTTVSATTSIVLTLEKLK